MALKVCVLASGSSGNCTYIGSETTGILLDAGIAARQIEQRLEQIGVAVSHIRGICISHEHTDHISGLSVLHRRHRIPAFANSATAEAIHMNARGAPIRWNVFTTGARFEIGDLQIEPFSVPHDAMDPVGFVVSHNGVRVGVATDVGMITSLLRERLKTCRVIVIEANHDEALLEASRRPWHLKQRIRGRQGHLSNRHLAQALAEIASDTLEHVFLAHLSQECNRCELAMQAVAEQLRASNRTHVRVSVTYPDRISDVWVG